MPEASAGTRSPSGSVRTVDRRTLLLDAAAHSFSRNGYHATKLSDIADEAGISTPALYRHFANKYELFAATTRRTAERVSALLDAVPPAPHPKTELTAVIRELADYAMTDRSSSDLYRRESSLLLDQDRRAITDLRVKQHRRLRGLIEAIRPDLTRSESNLYATAMVSVAVSVTSHRASLPRRAAVDLLTAAAVSLTDVRRPATDPPRLSGDIGLTPTARREEILSAAIALFADRGFGQVTLDHIGAAVDLPASGVYRHFASKQAILEAVLWRASDRWTAGISAGLGRSRTPREAVATLCAEYARICATDPRVFVVYLSSIGALDAAARGALRKQQRINADEWATWLQRARPGLSPSEARFLVHATLGLIAELSAEQRAATEGQISALATAVLLGP